MRVGWLMLFVALGACGQSYAPVEDGGASSIDAGARPLDGASHDTDDHWASARSTMFVGEDMTEPYAVGDEVALRIMVSTSNAVVLCDRIRSPSAEDAGERAIAVLAVRGVGEPIAGVYEYPSTSSRSVRALWAPFGASGEILTAETGSVVRAIARLDVPAPAELRVQVELELDDGTIVVHDGSIPPCYGLASGPLF